ncbi:hypothetical protein MSUIS_06880 [Mycoplasma suis KI3806]|uniref:Uncharacterized protein n=1 Tax=Mycoplasma suis (strain KI_3806) TaxID=708248 RepID=F0V2A0_MYCS3|nr:hypothetical protein [Mycoplasma suis]CBZ40781.1 hypothetical protein MSUIS_06880 [Mycoplasma suis KI3806]
MWNYCGGGALVSVVGSEISQQHISNALSYIGGKFSEWFKSSPQVQSVPEPSAQQQGAFEVISNKFQSLFKIVKDFFEQWVKTFQSDLKSLASFSSQAKELQEKQQTQLPEVNWRDFFNGIWILCHFSYRNVFKVEFGTLPYLLAGLFLDLEKWEWKVEKISEIYESFKQRFEKGFLGLLGILIQLNETGKQMSKSSNLHGRTPINITKRNILWYSVGSQWVELDRSKPEPSTS